MTYSAFDIVTCLTEIGIATVLSVLIVERLQLPSRSFELGMFAAFATGHSMGGSVWFMVFAIVLAPLMLLHPWGLIVGAPACLLLWLYRPDV